MLAPMAAVGAGSADQMGPPVSAAPAPKAPVAPYVPPKRAAPVAPLRNAAGDEATYERCLALAKTDPAAARDLAEHWLSRGGAHPADHCYAVALVGLKQYKDGAEHLEALAKTMDHAPDSLRADVLDQAAQAWLLQGDPARAPMPTTRRRSAFCRASDPTCSSTAPRPPAAKDGSTRPSPISTRC